MKITLEGFVIGFNENTDVLISEKKGNSYFMFTEGIAESIQRLIENSDGVKSYKDSKRKIGRNIDIIPDCSIRLYFSNDKFTLEEADMLLIDKLYGQYFSDKELTGYSEFTITGYKVSRCEIGGHDLLDIINSHKDEYMILVME